VRFELVITRNFAIGQQRQRKSGAVQSLGPAQCGSKDSACCRRPRQKKSRWWQRLFWWTPARCACRRTKA